MRKSEALQMATASALPAGDAVMALAAFSAPVPQPRLIMSEPEQPEMMTAYLPPLPQDPDAQRALEMIIARETAPTVTASIPTDRLPDLPVLKGVTGATGLRTASLGGNVVTDTLGNLFRGTFSAPAQNEPVAQALASHIAKRPTMGTMRQPDLIIPDLEHVAEVFITPTEMSSDHFAEIWDHDEADFSPVTEMGRYVTAISQRVCRTPVLLALSPSPSRSISRPQFRHHYSALGRLRRLAQPARHCCNAPHARLNNSITAPLAKDCPFWPTSPRHRCSTPSIPRPICAPCRARTCGN